MTEQEVQEIYDRLLKLTEAGKVRWKINWKITGEGELTTNFSRSSVAVEKRGSENPYGVMTIFNADGVMVAYVSPYRGIDLASGVRWFNLDPIALVELAENQVFKYSDTTKSILDELKELELSTKGER